MLGTVHGYYEIEKPREAWQIDSIVDSVSDAVAKLSSFNSSTQGTQNTVDRATILALKAKYMTTDLPDWLRAIEKRLEQQEEGQNEESV